MTSPLDGPCDLALILQRSASETTRQNLALLVEELLEELGVLVVNVLDTTPLEAAVLLLLDLDSRRGEIPDL